MSRRAQENLVGVIVLAVFVMLLYLTLGYSSRARLVPLPVAVLGIMLAVAQLFWQNFRSLDELRINPLDMVGNPRVPEAPAMQPGISGTAQQGAATGPKRKPGGELSAFGLIAALLALVFVIGPLPAVFFFTAGYLGLSRHCSPARAVLYGACCAVVLYGLFGFALGVPLNRGLISGFLGDYVDF
jgi:hypothetical protein